MKNIFMLISTNIKNNFSSKSVIIIWYGTGLFILAALIALFAILLISPEANRISPDISKLKLYLGIILFSASIIGPGINLSALGATSMIKEKARGNIQSLLATPLKLKEIWLGKSLAIFIPGLIFGELLTLISLFAINYIFYVPTVGFLLDPWIAIMSFLIIPIIFFCIGLLVYLVGITGKPVNANIIAQAFLPIYMNIIIQILIQTAIFDITSWPFALANIGLAVLIMVIVIILKPRLTRERITLSY